MSRSPTVAFPALVVAALVVAAGAGSALPDGADAASIVAVLPNPVATDDRGEYVVISLPRPTDLSGWALSDGESTAALPDRRLSGRVVATTDPDAVRPWVDLPVAALEGHLALANGGETVRLRRGGSVVDAVRYPDAPEGERYERARDGWRWRALGATDRPVVTVRDVGVRAFVLPDAPDVAVAPLGRADDRILLSGYTLTSGRVVRRLCAARARNATVRVLLEGSPVGGLARREATALDDLTACGVEVAMIGGDRARYAFHHAKYAVVDDRAVVLTENWKPAGTGGRSSRGWGVVIEDRRVAAALAETFRADAGWRDAIPWREYRRDRSFVEAPPPADGRYPRRFDPRAVDAAEVSVLVAPDNAEPAVIDLLDGAQESILVEQLSIGSLGHPFVRAILRAARRGVRVRVLLSSAPYVRESNREIARALTGRADREGLPVAVRLAEPRSRFGKVHAKGIVVDRETVVLGSLNWNNHSLRENREVAVVLRGDEPGRYYARVFRADWRGGVYRISAGFGVAVGGLVVAGAVVGRRSIRFGA